MTITLENALLSLMRDKVAVKAFVKTTTDGYGAPVYSTAANTTYQAHFTYERKAGWMKEGEVTLNLPVCWIATTATIDPRSRLIFNATTYRIGSVEVMRNALGTHHVKLNLEGG